jgi:hypothetical protein
MTPTDPTYQWYARGNIIVGAKFCRKLLEAAPEAVPVPDTFPMYWPSATVLLRRYYGSICRRL